MDEANALYMARRVMRRNLERAKDARSICDNDLLRSIILESTMWLHDFDTPEPSSKVDERCKHENTELNPYNSVFYCQDCGEAITTKFIIEGGKGQGE